MEPPNAQGVIRGLSLMCVESLGSHVRTGDEKCPGKGPFIWSLHCSVFKMWCFQCFISWRESLRFTKPSGIFQGMTPYMCTNVETPGVKVKSLSLWKVHKTGLILNLLPFLNIMRSIPTLLQCGATKHSGCHQKVVFNLFRKFGFLGLSRGRAMPGKMRLKPALLSV